MAKGLFENMYNPDVLSCLANLSNDEVFTSPDVVNKMLDLLPQEIFKDPNTTFLDPACKTGVFLREIAKRLIDGLEKEIPNLDERIDHIFTKQLYGISITELTSLLSRRSLYCSKWPNGEYSIVKFDNPEGNIRFKRIDHKWSSGSCIYCNATKKMYERDDSLESYAYQFIHTNKPEEIFNMKFDVIIGNPPYQLSTGGGSAQSTPLYNKFIKKKKKLKPRYLTMIVPSRWFTGGMGLNEFRREMMSDRRLKEIVDFVNAKDCFPGVSIGGGVNYFLWERDYNGPCKITNIEDNKVKSIDTRYLDEFPVLLRNNKAVSLVHKVAVDSNMEEMISAISPFGLPTYTRGKDVKLNKDDLLLHSSGGTGYIPKDSIKSGSEYLGKYKVLLSANTSEHAGEPSKDGTFKVFATIKVLGPEEVCTHSYILVGNFETQLEAENLEKYLETKFVRFLVLQSVSGISISKDKFRFVPVQDFTRTWTDEELYSKYNLDQDEIDLIENTIKSIDNGGE